MTKLYGCALACLLIAAPACDDGGDPAVADAGETVDASGPGNVDAGSNPGDVDAGSNPGDGDAGDVDGGAHDGGAFDAGDVDGGALDGGAFDGGSFDAGDVDGSSQTEEPTAFRITTLELLDPRPIGTVICLDATDIVNGQLDDAITGDGDQDGLLDLNAVMVFRPLDQAAAQSPLDVLVGADCTAPGSTTTCSANPAQSVVTTTAQNDSATACKVVVASSTNPDSDPAPSASATPCFAAAGPGSLILEIGGSPVELVDVAGSATYEGDPATGLIHGVLRGFVSETQANGITLQTDFGDFTLSSLLLGGQGNDCASPSGIDDDRDTGPNDESGWYIYLAFTANQVPFTE